MNKILVGVLIAGGLVADFAIGWVAGVACQALANEDEKAKEEGYEDIWDKIEKEGTNTNSEDGA